jgi:3'-phosphoadenosine 5'-phosphosulfate sulfotransferase (PAPS reductase)/FAD synthetase
MCFSEKEKQLDLWAAEVPPETPNLKLYDVILVNSSAGKDSQAMLDVVVERARSLGVTARVVVVHCDLGRVEWPGTRELAEEQARHYGLRFEVVKRAQGDLLSQVRHRRKWPDPKRRYCTSDQKRAPVLKLMTRLSQEQVTVYGNRPVFILNCLGMRAQESPARSKLRPFERDERASSGRRVVDRWLPIHDWSTSQVWERIRRSGVPHHSAYDLGMPRLSCSFCIFAPRSALVLAGTHRPELLAEYVAIEEEIGHSFRQHLRLQVIQEEVAAGGCSGPVEDWAM